MLHGGTKAFGQRLWKLGAHDGSSVSLTLELPDGEAGFPGALTATCVYRMLEPATLRVELSAVTDKPTVVNLTQHAYFNLDGSADILDHEVTLFAEFYTPADAELIPTGEIRSVAGTPYDFRVARPVRNASGTTYDTNFVAALPPGADGLAPVALLRSHRNGMTMAFHSSEPGVQLYDAAKLDCPVPGAARRALRGARRALSRGAGIPGFAEPPPLYRLRPATRLAVSPCERISLREWRLGRDDFRSTSNRGTGLTTRREVHPDASDRPVFEKSALHPVCQQSGVTGFEPTAAVTSQTSAARPVPYRKQERNFPVISTICLCIYGSGVSFNLLGKQIFSSLEWAEERTGPRRFSLLPGTNRETFRDQGPRRRTENRASRGGGQGKQQRPALAGFRIRRQVFG